MLPGAPRSSKEALLTYARQRYERPTARILAGLLLLSLLLLSPLLLVRRLSVCIDYSQAELLPPDLTDEPQQPAIAVPISITSDNLWSVFLSLAVDAYLGETGVRFAHVWADQVRVYGGGTTANTAHATPAILQDPQDVRKSGDFFMEHCGTSLASDAAHASRLWPMTMVVTGRLFAMYPFHFDITTEQPCVAGYTTHGPIAVPGLPGLSGIFGGGDSHENEAQMQICPMPALCAWSSCFSVGCSPFDLSCNDQAEASPVSRASQA